MHGDFRMWKLLLSLNTGTFPSGLICVLFIILLSNLNHFLASHMRLSSCYIRTNPLSANPTKCSNTLKQFIGKLPTNGLSVFDHFVWLTLKGLTVTLKWLWWKITNNITNQARKNYDFQSYISTPQPYIFKRTFKLSVKTFSRFL